MSSPHSGSQSPPISPEHPHQPKLVRSLGLLDIIMVGIAAMIAGAIFILIGPAINLAGGAVIVAFAINGLITLFTAMGYAEPVQPCPKLVGAIFGSEKDFLDQMPLSVDGWRGLLILLREVFMQ